MKDPNLSFGVANNYLASFPVVCLIMSIIDSRSMNEDERCKIMPLFPLQLQIETVCLPDEAIKKRI